ncbi:putative GPI-anchored protein pfl2 [Contarinia nasturtii]|uniref:putative GPI-anchored protein pfl2 n=1 Tax=Contarinia nasturtii TaxID=265458 RepID=UPI0012D42384|nr:putative GPI-anchored protein pfl2 [Contarinia nasturtii]
MTSINLQSTSSSTNNIYRTASSPALNSANSPAIMQETSSLHRQAVSTLARLSPSIQRSPQNTWRRRIMPNMEKLNLYGKYLKNAAIAAAGANGVVQIADAVFSNESEEKAKDYDEETTTTTTTTTTAPERYNPLASTTTSKHNSTYSVSPTNATITHKYTYSRKFKTDTNAIMRASTTTSTTPKMNTKWSTRRTTTKTMTTTNRVHTFKLGTTTVPSTKRTTLHISLLPTNTATSNSTTLDHTSFAVTASTRITTTTTVNSIGERESIMLTSIISIPCDVKNPSPLKSTNDNNIQVRKSRDIPIPWGTFGRISGYAVGMTAAGVVTSVADAAIHNAMTDNEKLVRRKPDCRESNYGCAQNLCWTNCGPRLDFGDWCYTKNNITKSLAVKFVECKDDDDCDPCWKCAGSCTFDDGNNLAKTPN